MSHWLLNTVAGAAIGFALTQTKGVVLAWSQMPLGLAMASWSLSFWCGLRQLDSVLATLALDSVLRDIEAGTSAVGEAGGTGVEVVVPPRRPATASPKATGPWKQRNQHIERIAEVGRQAWQKETGYRQQARVEGTFLRYKRILGGSLRAKGFEAQQREAMVGCTVLNKMLALGEAQSSAVAE